MKNRLKQTTSLLIIIVTFFQMGCAGKNPTVMSLDEAKFDDYYRYNVKLKSGKVSGEVPGSKISHHQNETRLQSSSRIIVFQDSEIQKIAGQSTKRTGSHVGEGALIGATIFGTVGAIGGFVIAKGLAEGLCDSTCNNDNTSGEIYLALLLGVIGALTGGVVGGGIGLAIPKHEKVEIAPVLSTSKKSGTTAGGSLQFRF